MATPALECILSTHRYFAFVTPSDDLVLAERTGATPPRQLFAGRDAAAFLRAVAQQRPFLYCWREALLANIYGDWQQLRTPAELDAALHYHAHFCALPPTQDPHAITWGNVDPDAPLAVCLESAGLILYEHPQRIICDRALASAKTFPKVVGFLAHPIAGTPVERWLYPEHP